MIFSDPVYDKMDDLMKMVEPFVYDDGGFYETIPSKVDITKLVKENLEDRRTQIDEKRNITIDSVLSWLNSDYSRSDIILFRKLFKMESSGPEGEDIVYDPDKKELNYSFYMVKEGISPSEELIKEHIISEFNRSWFRINDKGTFNDRYKYVAETLGFQDADFSNKKKWDIKDELRNFKEFVKKTIREGSFRVRELNLAVKFCNSLHSYLDGHASEDEIIMVTRILSMWKNERPIYSLTELNKTDSRN